MSDEKFPYEFIEYPKGEWIWCTNCERAYQVGDFRLMKIDKRSHWYAWLEETLDDFGGYTFMCPYDKCGGSSFLDFRSWTEVRGFQPDYPEVPERDVFYSLYG